MFGDGSDGALNLTSGTHNLALNQKHQFTSVNIGSGATLSTTSSTGSVLYITALTEIVIDGKIDVSGRVNPGRSEWPVTIDGVTYTSPGVPNAEYYANTSNINYGFGGGGGGVSATMATIGGGTLTLPTSSPTTGGFNPSGGGSVSISRSTNGNTVGSPKLGQNSGGSSGAAGIHLGNISGSGTATATAGRGGQTYGADGQNGSTNIPGTLFGSYSLFGGGGGGAGGIAGRAGVHVVLKAPKVIINGQIITSGTNGGDGGDGGRSSHNGSPYVSYGAPGMGGSGGNAGNVIITYADEYENDGTLTMQGGAGGAAGYGGLSKTLHPPNSPNGSNGLMLLDQVTDTSLYARTIYPTLASPSTTLYEPALAIEPLYILPTLEDATSTFYGVKVTMFIEGDDPDDSELTFYEPEIQQTPPPPPPPTDWSVIGKEDKKVYVYRVYAADGTYIGTWDGQVIDDPEFTQHINTPGTTMTVQLARSPNNMRETRSIRITEDGNERITESGGKRINISHTPNTVGDGTDVELNHNVDVYAHYGEFRTRVTEQNRVRVTEDGHVRITASGAPGGVRIFSGFILDYDSEYAADSTGVTVTLASHGYELSHQLIKDGNKTNVTFASQPIETTIKAILDTNPGTMSYEAETIDSTGVSVPAKFQLNTKLEGIEYLVEQADAGWYWFGHVGENNIYVKQVSQEPDHIFVKGKHIKSLRLKRSMENLINEVYFVGGETVEGDPTSVLYRRYSNPTSQSAWRIGLHRKTDRRYTLATSTQRYADKLLDENAEPSFTTPLTISSARYNIETIKLGQTVAFRNFGNFIDDVVLQIVSLKYTPTEVTVELGTILERQVDTLSKLEQALDNDQYETIPDTPS